MTTTLLIGSQLSNLHVRLSLFKIYQEQQPFKIKYTDRPHSIADRDFRVMDFWS